ncbi:MAG: hypothetical protein ABIP17_13535 [Ilumatobacteraceae bacterium]
MLERWSNRGHSWPAILGWCALYGSISVIVLYPILATPVVADDLFNPFGQFDVAGPGAGSAVRYGWEGATGGVSFRVIGNPFGALYNWLWLAAGARFGVSLTTFFAVTKLIVLVLDATAIAWTWRNMSELYARVPIAFTSALCWVSLTLFGTAQIHAGWSNDPVADYPLAGYGSAALGFLTIGTAARLASRQQPRYAVAAVVASTVAVMYYEINIGAVIGAAVLLAAVQVSEHHADRSTKPTFLIGAVAVPVVPAMIVIAGRFVTSSPSDGTYAGTTVRFDRAAITFIRGVVTSIPGSTWRLSISHLGGRLGLVFFVFGTVALVAMALRLTTMAADGNAAHNERSNIETWTRRGWLIPAGCVATVVIYATFSLALQSITVKVQDEAPAVGYVYTWYAMTSSAVALLLATGARRIARHSYGSMGTVVVVLSLCFLFVQNTVNWRLSEQLTESYGANRRLLDAFADEVPVERRCATLVNWTSIDWPGYYEDGIVDGLQEAFAHYFDEPFCPFGFGDG